MAIERIVQAELDRIGSFQAQSRTLQLEIDGRQVIAELLELNALACAFRTLSVFLPELKSADIHRLEAIGSRLSKNLTYLLEPIQPIEIDADQCIVQMRSAPPSVSEESTSYYELVVKKPGQIALIRYSKTAGN